MIAGEPFSNTFGMVKPGDVDMVPRVAKAAATAGFAVVFCRPGTKVPMCPLTARAAKVSDAAARTLGLPRHECGLSHALTDPVEVSRAASRLSRTGPVNLGVELGRSRYVVVDVDTADQRGAFLAAWSEATGADETHRTPTVLSPGSLVNGEWIHSNGGHYWFSLPEGTELPTGTGYNGVLTHPSGWTVSWDRHQVLVPPSARPEGPYKLIGQAMPLPEWLVKMITSEAESRRTRVIARADRAFDSDDPIETWSAKTTWSALLLPDGWIETGLVDTCTCPIFTAPGQHASPKSATAHDLGCTKYDTTTGWGPLHVWTDNPPEWLSESKTFTKLQYVAAREFGGDSRAAMIGTGILQDHPDIPDIEIDVSDVLGLGAPDDCPFDLADTTESIDTHKHKVKSCDSANGLENIPAEFWESRPVLMAVYQAALHSMCSPDALLMTLLARLAAIRAHTITLDIGLGPTGLNLIVCPVGPSSAGKGLAMAAAARLLPAPEWLVDFRDGIGLGSGEGVAEAFMGSVREETGEVYASGRNAGQPKLREVRRQTRNNVLFALDEGQTLGKMTERAGATIMPALRSAWSGATLGQANARSETTRIVPSGSYSTAVVLAFQPSTAAAVLDDTDGLAQRALWCSATHPAVTADEVPHPGELVDVVTCDDPMDPQPLVMRFPDPVRAAYRAHRAAVMSGVASQDPLDGHGPLVTAKVAALLTLLDGRTDPQREDVELARILWDTSRNVRTYLMGMAERERADRSRKRQQEQVAVRVQSARLVRTEEDKASNARLVQAARSLALRVADRGPLPRRVACKTLSQRNGVRAAYDEVVQIACESGWLSVDDDGILSQGVTIPLGTG
jgi:hypothetical protein